MTREVDETPFARIGPGNRGKISKLAFRRCEPAQEADGHLQPLNPVAAPRRLLVSEDRIHCGIDLRTPLLVRLVEGRTEGFGTCPEPHLETERQYRAQAGMGRDLEVL